MDIEHKSWQLLHSETPIDFKLFKARVDHVKNPRTGKTVQVTVLTGNDSVNVMALTKEGQVVLVDNYRFGIGAYILELPGGMVDDGEDHLQAAKRELLEETGYSATEWYYCGCVASNPVFMDSYIHHYLAIGAEKTAQAELDDGEDIHVREVPFDEVKKMLYNGEFQHPHTVSGVLKGVTLFQQGL